MKISVERNAFSEAVMKLQKVVGSKTSMPVLEGILLSAEKGKLTLAAYNLEMGIKKEMYSDTAEEGDIVISARILSEILRRLDGPYVEIESNERLMCKIISGSAVFDIMGMAASDFPEMPSVAEGEKIRISGEVLCDMVRETIFAVSSIEGTRPVLTGLDVVIKDGTLQFVGVDGFRLAIRKEKTDIKGNSEFIIAGKAVSEVVKLITDESEEIEITVGKRLVSFSIEGYTFISRLLEGEYIDFMKIIPKEFKQETVVNRDDFVKTVERVSLLINDSFTTPVRCFFEEGGVNLTCATAMGRAKERFELNLTGPEFEIGLNSRYLLEALKACNPGNVRIKFSGANTGVLLTPEDENCEDYLYLIMPMRLK